MDQNPLPCPLSERIRLLSDELTLAIQWNAACILVAAYRSQDIRDKVEAALGTQVGLAGHSVQSVRITRGVFDIPRLLRDHPQRSRTVFLVSGLHWGGGRGYSNAYRALNMHREYLVERRIRSIFWATAAEMKQLPRHAPDFWAFRHKVVEFLDLPPVQEADLPGSKGDDLEALLAGAVQAVKRDPASLAAHRRLGEIYRAAGCHEEAVVLFRKLTRLAPAEPRHWSALSEAYRAVGQEDLAGHARRKAERLAGKGRPAS